MRLRSKGLGRREMVMDFREYHVRREDDELVIVGVIRDPVSWDFSMRFCEDDYPAVLRLVLNRHTLWCVFRSLFRIPKKHHWGVERKEHYAEGQKVKELVRTEVDARVQSAMLPIAEKPKRKRRTAKTDTVETAANNDVDTLGGLNSSAA